MSSTSKRANYAALNLLTALIGPPTSLVLIYVAYIQKSKPVYITVGLIALIGLIYYMYLYFTNAQDTDNETLITGDPVIAQNSYIVNGIIEICFIVFCFIGYNAAVKQSAQRSVAQRSVAPRPTYPPRKSVP